MEFLFPFLGLFGFGCFSVVPTALAAAAIVDVLRVRAEWYWICIALIVPVAGPLAYFLISYGPWANRMDRFSPNAAKRHLAKHRLKELNLQLQHWRGPSRLAEAGLQSLALGRKKQAEAFFREAHEAGAEPKEVNLDYALLLQVRGGRHTEAIPLLEALVELDPDYKFGAARLALARSLDATDQAERAEEQLRALLVKRNPPEAKVRLARLLLRRGENQEASELLAEVRADADAMPAYLRRQHKPWIRKARWLRGGNDRLPAPRLEGLTPRRNLWPVVIAALVILLVVGWTINTVAPWVGTIRDGQGYAEAMGRHSRAALRVEELDRRFAADDGPTDLARIEAWLELRTALGGHCEASGPVPEEPETLGPDGEFDHENYRQSMETHVEITEAEAALLENLALELSGQRMGRKAFDRMVKEVDWQLLGREQALALALPEHFRGDYLAAEMQLEEELPPRTYPDWRKTVSEEKEKARAKIEDFRARAEEQRTADATFDALFEPHREALDASLDGACLERLVTALEKPSYEEY